MSKFIEMVAGVFAPAMAALGAEELQKVFAKVHAKSPARHAALLRTLNVAIQEVKPISDSSATKFDNVAVDGLDGAVQQSAAQFGVNLYQIEKGDVAFLEDGMDD